VSETGAPNTPWVGDNCTVYFVGTPAITLFAGGVIVMEKPPATNEAVAESGLFGLVLLLLETVAVAE
jgi:hypothetical protein